MVEPALSQASKNPNHTPMPDASKFMTLFVMTVATLYFGREVLVPITLALILAFILTPLVIRLRRWHLGRVPSVLLSVLFAIGVISAIGGVIGSQIAELSTNLPEYVTTVEAKVNDIKNLTIGQLTKFTDSIGRRQLGNAASSRTTSSAPTQVSQPSILRNAPTAESGSPLTLVERYLSPILSPLATLGIVFVVAIFVLLQREDLRDRLIRFIGSNDLRHTTLAIDEAARRLSRYFATQLAINTAFGIFIGIGLLIIGVPNPVLWTILSALLRFVPYIGSMISAVLPIALAAAVDPGWSMLIWTSGLYAGAEMVTGQAIEPLVYGNSTGLSPFSVVVAAIFWSWIWGPIGLILSTPLTLCLVVMGRHMRRLEFLDVILGDRPVLTPIESFYQRVLAGDADELQDHAESLLKDQSLVSYYDEVVLAGLRLATNDAQRGALDHAQLVQVKETIISLAHGLKDYINYDASKTPKAATDIIDPADQQNGQKSIVPSIETAPPPLLADSAPATSVLCVSGRFLLDDAAAAILLQLLTRMGVNARGVEYTAMGREQINNLDVSGIKQVCICFLDINGNPAHLRYLIRRLRQKLPATTPIIVGIWPVADLQAKDTATRLAIGADNLSTSFSEMVNAVLSEKK